MELNDYINNLDFSSQLNDVNQLLSQAQSNVTFWGKRIVTVVGYTGSISLDELATKVLNAAQKGSDLKNFTDQELNAGKEIMVNLRKFYKDSDAQSAQKKFLYKSFNCNKRTYNLSLHCSVSY
jgi:hypothetical protein